MKKPSSNKRKPDWYWPTAFTTCYDEYQDEPCGHADQLDKKPWVHVWIRRDCPECNIYGS